MNVLLILHWMKVDGSATYYTRLAKKLVERGHRVSVASAGGALADSLEGDGIRHYRLRGLFILYASMYMHIFDTLSYLKRRKRANAETDGDIISHLKKSRPEKLTFLRAVRFISFAASFCFWAFFSALRLFRIVSREGIDVIEAHSACGIAMAIWCHWWGKIPFVANVANPNFWALPKSMFDFVSENASCVIAISGECMKYLTNDHDWRQKIEVIHNFVDTAKFRPFSKEETDSYLRCLMETGYPIGAKSSKIVLVTRVDEDKRNTIESCIQAMEEVLSAFAGVQLIIAGDGKMMELIRNMAELTNSALKESAIVVIGHVTRVEKVMNLADVVIGVGGVVIEAMACSKPVIVAGHVVGAMGGSFGGIVSPANLEELQEFYFTGRNSPVETNPSLVAASIKELLGDKGLRRRLGYFGRDFVLRNCSLDASVSRIERIYFQAIDEERRGSSGSA